MISATATFAVLKRQSPVALPQVVTILIGLADIQPHDVLMPALPSYAEAVHIAIDRGLAREPRIGLLRKFGLMEFVTVSERIVFPSSDELDALVAAMT